MPALLALIVLLAAAPFQIADVPGSAATPLRVGSSANDSNAEGFYAVENGFFKQAGLNVEMTQFNNGDAAAAAMAAGSIDIGIQPPMQIAQGVTRGLPFTIVAAGAMNTVNAPAGIICVAKNSPLRNAKDLEGKTIAINSLKSSSENLLDAWLAKNGADVSKIKILELPSAQMAAALERGTIDAAELFEPAYTAAMTRGAIRMLANPTSAMRNEYLQTAWYTTKQFAAQNPDAIKKFAAAIYQTARWANAHPRDSGAVLVKLSKLDPDLANTMIRVRYAESLQVADLLPELEFGYKNGLLPRAVPASELLTR